MMSYILPDLVVLILGGNGVTGGVKPSHWRRIQFKFNTGVHTHRMHGPGWTGPLEPK